MMNNIIGFGLDIVDLMRIRHMLEKHGQQFVRRIYTNDEWAYCEQHEDPVPHLAARFAAKEAVAKALSTGIGKKCAFIDVEVTKTEYGKPGILLHNAAGITAREAGITNWSLTLSHSKTSAVAAVIGMGIPSFNLQQ